MKIGEEKFFETLKPEQEGNSIMSGDREEQWLEGSKAIYGQSPSM
jgi:beta-lactamase class D